MSDKKFPLTGVSSVAMHAVEQTMQSIHTSRHLCNVYFYLILPSKAWNALQAGQRKYLQPLGQSYF